MPGFREILTFQLGNYSNFVSTHWWNLQEASFSFDPKNPSEICHDVLFREGKTLRGEVTFTPRTIVIDKKVNSFLTQTLNEDEELSVRDSVVTWDSERISSTVLTSPGTTTIPEKHEYIQDLEKMEMGKRVEQKDYKFEQTARSWCDFMRTRYHPKSLALLNNNLKTEIFHSGVEIHKGIDELIEEKVRSYVEECNNIQGFHVLVDAVDAYGGLADQIALHLVDEYPNKTIFAMPLIPNNYNEDDTVNNINKMINILLCYQKLAENCDIVIPLGTNKTAWKELGPPIRFPHLNYDSQSIYQTSAIVASYLDTFSLKYRINEEQTLHEIASGLNFWNRKICAASLSLPFPMSTGAYLLDTLENLDESSQLWNCLTPGCSIGNEKIFYQRVTIRGVSNERLRDPAITRRDSEAYTCTSVSQLLQLFLSFHVNTISDVTSAKTPLKTELPFPKIFSKKVSRLGTLEDRDLDSDVYSCPVLAGLHSCKDIGRMLESLHFTVKGLNMKRFHQFFGVGMDMDEYKECLEKLTSLENDYLDNQVDL